MELKGVDTHCHPQFAEFTQDRHDVIARARASGIGMICVGTDVKTSREAVAMANAEDGVWAAVGRHPNEPADPPYDEAVYESLLHEERVVAVGEIGLDFHRSSTEERAGQQDIFLRQLLLATRLGLPCIIHCRDAHEAMLELLRGKKDKEQESINSIDSTNSKTIRTIYARGVIHSFNESPDIALSYISLGWYIGLNGIITFSRAYDELVRALPLDRILLETDAPYLSPVPYRGKRNEPLRILDIASHIANVRGITTSKVQQTTTRNAYECFPKLR